MTDEESSTKCNQSVQILPQMTDRWKVSGAMTRTPIENSRTMFLNKNRMVRKSTDAARKLCNLNDLNPIL
jgi:hypothetical protein